jgi:MerR family transcriptional regulator, light-induced transcriptional regulator
MTNVPPWDDPERPRASLDSGNSASARQTPGTGQSMTRLLRTIEGEIIPRLLLAHQSAPAARGSEGIARGAAQSEDITEFARLVMAHDVAVATSFIQAMLARGLLLEQIYLDLLAPAARLLGEWWEEDLRDFTEVTSGLCRMHQLLHEFAPAFMGEAELVHDGHRVLLVPMPGEQHTFGLIMVGEFFRRAGWDVWDMYPGSAKDLQALAHSQWFSVIGVSLSCETRIEELPLIIRGIRAASRNPAVGVMVGGMPFIGRLDLVAAVGADCSASDGRRAAIEATKLIGLRENRV